MWEKNTMWLTVNDLLLLFARRDKNILSWSISFVATPTPVKNKPLFIDWRQDRVVSRAGFGLILSKRFRPISGLHINFFVTTCNRVDWIFNKSLLIANHLVTTPFILLRHYYPAVADILTHSITLALGLNRTSKINLGLGPGFKMRPVCNSATRRASVIAIVEEEEELTWSRRSWWSSFCRCGRRLTSPRWRWSASNTRRRTTRLHRWMSTTRSTTIPTTLRSKRYSTRGRTQPTGRRGRGRGWHASLQTRGK